MYTITEVASDKFELHKDGDLIGVFPTREDAEKAQGINSTATWVDDGKGLEYPEGTDNVHSGDYIVDRPPTPGGVAATSHVVQAAPAYTGPVLIGKTVASVSTFQHGSVFVVDVFCTDGNHYYLKTKQGALEIGGTQDWDTGVKS